MKTMAISKFKTYALKVIDKVAKSQEGIIITKRGKPLAELIPFPFFKGETCTRKTGQCTGF